MADTVPVIDVLGTKIAALNPESAVAVILAWLKQSSTGHCVCVTGVHGVMESLRSPVIRRAHNGADACVPDGMPMTWIGWLRGHKTMDRVYGPDLMLTLLELSATHAYKNFFYGGAEGVADELAGRMIERFPDLRVVGTMCPPFRPLEPVEKERVISAINEVRPDLLWVGLSTPKQELFMADFRRQLEAKVMLGVGAAFDFHTGRVRQAPRWMMRAGLEWLFRLCMEPRRLAPRYLRNNPAFLWHFFLQQAGIRDYPLE
jgi:N-acetylglucosaminyldiphosphoundecaprenol N-acetyl-beta-D-mannosaminyltransferase